MIHKTIRLQNYMMAHLGQKLVIQMKLTPKLLEEEFKPQDGWQQGVEFLVNILMVPLGLTLKTVIKEMLNEQAVDHKQQR